MLASMLAGITVLLKALMRARTARDTSTAFSPGFLVTVSVRAGFTLPAWAESLAGVCQTKRWGICAPDSSRATSRKYTGKPCKACGETEKYVINAACVACTKNSKSANEFKIREIMDQAKAGA